MGLNNTHGPLSLPIIPLKYAHRSLDVRTNTLPCKLHANLNSTETYLPRYLRPIRYCADRAKVAKSAANTMSGPNADSFQRALRSFKQSISQQTPELLGKFEIGSLDDLQNHCMQIQNKMGQNGEMRRMRRLQGFIEAMSQLGQSIEVFVNANELVCFIWVGFFH